jgi:polyisoprenoid-binding protein YceI
MSTPVSIPGYTAGTYVIDKASSQVGFVARLLGFAKVRGSFEDVEGTITLADNPLDSSVHAVIKAASVLTKNKKRDDHLRHDDFLNAEKFPEMTFASTGVRADGGRFLVDGDLTIRDVTKPVTLTLDPKGFSAEGGGQASFSATTAIVCTDYGVTRGKSAFAVGARNEIVLEITARKKG